MEISLIVALTLFGLLFMSLLGSLLRHDGARKILIWFVIITGVTLVASGWESFSQDLEPQQTRLLNGRIEVPKSRDNHFHITLDINNVPVDFLIDTGASQMVLTLEDAERIGLNPDDLSFSRTAFTANGEVATAPVQLDEVQLDSIRDTRVRASVNSGEMEKSLLGMSYLSRFESIEIRQNTLILHR